MAKNIKKLFVVGSLVGGLFMALTACNINGESKNPDNSSNINISSNQTSDSQASAASSSSQQASSQPVVLSSITAVSNKEAFEFGEELSLTVYANYSDGSSEQVTDYLAIGYNANIPGEQNVVVSYQGKLTTLTVKVNDPILVEINVVNNEEAYEWGQDLNLTVTATYSDNSTVTINDYEVEGYNKEEAGEQTVTVKYGNKTTSFKVTVNNPSLVNIVATPSKDAYEWGEDLDLTVSASYSDNSSKEVTDYKVEGYDKEKSGEQTVTVTYEDKTYTFKVTVNNPVLVSITAVSNKDAYENGEDLDITVIGTYSDNSTVELSNYQVEGYNKEEAGDQNLTITFEGKTCSLSVKVKEKPTFPLNQLNDFLQLQAIKTEIPTPASSNQWADEVKLEQDGSKYFFASTSDNGTVGSDSLADQYKVLLTTKGWTVNEEKEGYVATKAQADAIIIFKTEAKVFSMKVESYCEFPDKAIVTSLVSSKGAVADGTVVVLANAEQEMIVKGLDGKSLGTESCLFTEDGTAKVEKDVVHFTAHKSGSYYTFSDVYGRKLGAKGVGELAWDEGSTEWSLLFSNGLVVLLNATKAYGRLAYDPQTGLVSTYKSIANTELVYPQMFKLVETDLIYPTSISVKGKEEVALTKTAKMSLEYVPSNANSLSEVVWVSSNEAVATVRNGVVTGVSVGKATITAKTKSKNNYLESSFVVEVKEQVLDSWTIMLYLCGSNLESSYGFATADIAEILSVNNQPEDVNFIIETGGSTSWHNYGISSNKLGRYHVENKNLVLDTQLTYANMGKQSTLESFLNWGLQEYPADKTGVIFWNHGGALGGVCFDDINGSDSLVNSEIASACENVFADNGIDKLEFIGYDACLMQIQDMAGFNYEYFNFQVASEESEAGEGWVYNKWLDDVYADNSTEKILEENCDGFVDEYDSDQTLSYLDLSKFEDYYNKFEAMAAAIKTTAKNNSNSFKSLIGSCKDYGSDYWSSGLYSFGEIDGMDFLNKLGNNSLFSSFSSQINEAKAAYNNLVAYSRKGSSAGNSNGLGIIAGTYVSYPASETTFNNWRSIFY